MKIYLFNFVILFLIVNILQVSSYGESDIDGNPIYPERASLLLINAARIDPIGYRTKYYAPLGYSTTNVLNNFPKVNPVYESNGLSRAAKLHSLDMASTPCMEHDNCNGTMDTFNRIRLFHTCASNAWGENIAMGYNTPEDVNGGWICENYNDKNQCFPDGDPRDGHRRSIMNGDYGAVGVGIYYTASGTAYWTQDFASKPCDTQLVVTEYPIHSGSHIFMKSTTKAIYMASFHNPTVTGPVQGRVVFDSGSQPLVLSLGSEKSGVYIYETSPFTACAKYFFEFKVGSGKVYRYPNTGALTTVVNRNSQCDSWTSSSPSSPPWDSQSSTTSVPTTGSSTTSLPTTTSSTTSSSTTTKPTTTTTTTTKPTTTTTSSTTTKPTTTTTTTSNPTTTTSSSITGATSNPTSTTTTGGSTTATNSPTPTPTKIDENPNPSGSNILKSSMFLLFILISVILIV
eukprot:gene9943-12193_t